MTDERHTGVRAEQIAFALAEIDAQLAAPEQLAFAKGWDNQELARWTFRARTARQFLVEDLVACGAQTDVGTVALAKENARLQSRLSHNALEADNANLHIRIGVHKAAARRYRIALKAIASLMPDVGHMVAQCAFPECKKIGTAGSSRCRYCAEHTVAGYPVWRPGMLLQRMIDIAAHAFEVVAPIAVAEPTPAETPPEGDGEGR